AATAPFGISTKQRSPARAAYAAADADVLPVDAQMTAVAPRRSASVTATVMPRSLNDPVGLAPSYLRYSSAAIPSSRASRGAGRRGVSPSPSVTTGPSAASGKNLP